METLKEDHTDDEDRELADNLEDLIVHLTDYSTKEDEEDDEEQQLSHIART